MRVLTEEFRTFTTCVDVTFLTTLPKLISVLSKEIIGVGLVPAMGSRRVPSLVKTLSVSRSELKTDGLKLKSKARLSFPPMTMGKETYALKDKMDQRRESRRKSNGIGFRRTSLIFDESPTRVSGKKRDVKFVWGTGVVRKLRTSEKLLVEPTFFALTRQ